MDLTAYDRLVDHSPQGSVFCHTWWLDAVAPGQYEVLTVEKGNQLQAAWPIVWARDRSRLHLRMPPLTQKLGILFSPHSGKYAERLSREHRLVNELLDKLAPGTYVRQHFHENFTNWLPFYWRGYKQSTRYTYLLEDLTDLDAIWSQMRNTTRTEVRKAKKRGIRARETDDLEYFYSVATKTYSRQGMATPYSLELVHRIDTACVKNAGRKILVAEDATGRAHACTYLVYDQRCAVLLLTGADEELRASGAGPFLNWELIQFASSTSKKFDFEGSMVRPIEQCFRGFGGRQVPYYQIFGTQIRPTNSRLRRFTGRVLRKVARIVDPS